MKIYTVRIAKIEKDIFDDLLWYVSIDERKRIGRFRRYQDALRGLIAKILLRYIIVSLLGEYNSNIRIDKNKYGKPFLAGENDFHFNLSHSGDWVVCVVDNMPVGIDVEKIHDVDLNLSERFFSQEEHKYLLTMDIKKRRETFFKFWTLKESYIKADGRGLSIPLNSFSFSFENEDIKFKTINCYEDFYFKLYEIDNSYKLAVCAKNTDFPEDITNIPLSELINLAKKYLDKTV